MRLRSRGRGGSAARQKSEAAVVGGEDEAEPCRRKSKYRVSFCGEVKVQCFNKATRDIITTSQNDMVEKLKPGKRDSATRGKLSKCLLSKSKRRAPLRPKVVEPVKQCQSTVCVGDMCNTATSGSELTQTHKNNCQCIVCVGDRCNTATSGSELTQSLENNSQCIVCVGDQCYTATSGSELTLTQLNNCHCKVCVLDRCYIATSGSELTHKYQLCDKKFSTQEKLTNHIDNHLMLKQENCEILNLTLRPEDKHPENCEVCDVVLKTEEELNEHLKSHLEVQDFRGSSDYCTGLGRSSANAMKCDHKYHVTLVEQIQGSEHLGVIRGCQPPGEDQTLNQLEKVCCIACKQVYSTRKILKSHFILQHVQGNEIST